MFSIANKRIEDRSTGTHHFASLFSHLIISPRRHPLPSAPKDSLKTKLTQEFVSRKPFLHRNLYIYQKPKQLRHRASRCRVKSGTWQTTLSFALQSESIQNSNLDEKLPALLYQWRTYRYVRVGTTNKSNPPQSIDGACRDRMGGWCWVMGVWVGVGWESIYWLQNRAGNYRISGRATHLYVKSQ